MTRARDLSKFQAGANITANTAFVPDTADGATLGTSALEFSDLFLADSGTIKFGADQDTVLTHVPDTGVDIVTTNTQSVGGDTYRASYLKLSTHTSLRGITFDDRSSSYVNFFEGLYARGTNIINEISMNSANYFKIKNTDDSGGGGDLVTVTSASVTLADDMKFATENGYLGPNSVGITDGHVLQATAKDLSLVGYIGEVHLRSGGNVSDYAGRLNAIVKETGVELYGGAGGASDTPILYFRTDANGPQLSPGDSTAKVGVGTMAGVIHNSYDTEFNIGGANHARLKLNATNYGNTASDGLDLYVYQTSSSLINRENGYLRFGTAANIRMLISNTGNVGINNTSPTFKLDVNGSARFMGTVSFNTHAYFGDNDVIYLGTSSDLRIYHNGTNSYVNNTTGNLLVQSGANAYMLVNGGENAVACVANGAVGLYHNNVEKLVTSSGGVSVTGTVTATAFSGDGSSLTGVGGSTTFAAVGTYLLSRSQTAVDANNTTSGSNMRAANCAGSTQGGGQSGTWRVMGKADSSGSSLTGRTSVFVRIS